MAFVIKDRVRETTTTTGTSAISLGGTSTSFEAFGDHMSNADTTHYAIVHSTADEWEVGLGTWNTGNTLTRTTVLSSSNSNAAVSFTSGSKDVFMTYPASQSVSNLPLSGGTMTGDVLHGDNIKAKFGTGNDLEIYHDGSHSVIHDVGEGHLKLLGQDLIIAKESSGILNQEYYIYCATDSSVFLYYDGNAVMGTVSGGISVIGNITVSGNVDGRDVATDGTKLDAIEANATADQTKSDIDALGINASSVSGFTVGVSVPSNALFTDTDTTYSVGDGGLTTNDFTNADHTKLDGIATSANNYTHPNHSGEVTSTADGATVIADNVVDEANLKVSNTPTNGYVLTAQSGNTGGLTWAASSLYETVGTITTGTIDLATGNVFADAPSANATYVFSNPAASGLANGFTLKITPSATVTITWPTSVDWAGGTAPDAPASGATNIYTFYTTDGGTTYYGFLAGGAMA